MLHISIHLYILVLCIYSHNYQPEKLANKTETKDETTECESSPPAATEASTSAKNTASASTSSNESAEDKQEVNMEYELIGITVHTGTADGGHYYSFIRDKINCEPGKPDKW